MVLYPGVQKTAQEELARVVGSDRLPRFEDRDSLPYVTALTLEVLRWEATVPSGMKSFSCLILKISKPVYEGVPHLIESEDFFRGYYIPANSVVIPNAWFVHLVIDGGYS